MSEEEKDNKKNVVEDKPNKNRIIRWVLLCCAVVIIGLGSYFGWNLYKASGDEGNRENTQLSETAGKTKEKDARVIYPMESFIVNLIDKSGSGNHYLKATIELEVGGEEEKGILDANKTQLRDAILMLLSSRSVEEINTVEGKLDLKQVLLPRINQTLSGNIVRRLYFTEFVTQ